MARVGGVQASFELLQRLVLGPGQAERLGSMAQSPVRALIGFGHHSEKPSSMRKHHVGNG
jgi:hypothetical protein